MVLEPWLYGRRTGVSPLALLIAATFWTWLWGAVGLLLAVPLTVCLMVLGKHIPQLEFFYVLLGDEPMLEPHEQLYQRLLAGKREEAETLLTDALQSKSPRKVCDEVIVPAVQLAERDHARGSLDEAQRAIFRDIIDQWTQKLSKAKAPAGPLRRLSECAARVNAWKSTVA